ncbi:MAG: two-component regulator propeller domain-containing protein [Anaerolineales bacterium]
MSEIYIPLEFVFEPGIGPETLYFRNVRYLAEEIPSLTPLVPSAKPTENNDDGNLTFMAIPDGQEFDVNESMSTATIWREDGSVTYLYETNSVRRFADTVRPMTVVAADGTPWRSNSDGGVTRFDSDAKTVFTTANGLADDKVSALAAPANGDIWVGTPGNGISKFDGISWQTYTTKDGLAGNVISAIAVAPDGAVWVGTLQGQGLGISSFDGKTWTTHDVKNEPVSHTINSIAVGLDGVVWVGTAQGLLRFDGADWKYVSYYDDSTWVAVLLDGDLAWAQNYQGVTSVAVTPDNVVWIGTARGNVYRFDGSTWTPYHLISDATNVSVVRSIYIDSEGVLWFGTLGGGPRHF